MALEQIVININKDNSIKEIYNFISSYCKEVEIEICPPEKYDECFSLFLRKKLKG